MDAAARIGDRVVAVLLFVTIVLFAIHKIVEYDLWWQLKMGDWVLTHGFPHTDPFSYAFPDRPWIEMRWIYGIAINQLFTHFGLNSLIVAKSVVVVLIFACVWIVDPEAPVWARCLGIACALIAAHLRFLIRPELLTMLFVAFVLLALCRYRSSGRRAWIYVLPLLQVIWTNTHTVFVLGPVTVAIFAIAEYGARWLPIRTMRDRAMAPERAKPLFVVAAASILACFASPYFVQGALFPFQLFSQIQAGNTIREMITELQSPFAYAGFTVFFMRYPIVVAISAFGFALNRRRIAPGLLALWCAYLYLSAQSERNLSLFGFVAGVTVIANYGEAWRAESPWKHMRSIAWISRVACALLALLAIPAVATDYYYRRIDPARRFGFGVADNRFPLRAVTFVDEQSLPQPILADLVASNYVLFDHGPDSVFVDGRLEIYGGDILKTANDLFRTGAGFDEIVARNGIQTVIVTHTTDGDLFRTLNRKDDWAPVYFDETDVVFVRITPETHAMIDALRVDWTAPRQRVVTLPDRIRSSDPLAGLWPHVADNVAVKSLGQLALLTGNLILARERFEEAHRIRPDDADTTLLLGVVCRALGDDATATPLLASVGGGAVRITTPAAAAAAFESAGTLESAVATYEGIVARGGGTPDVYQKLAEAALGANELDNASRAYRHLVESSPNSTDAWNSLGMIASERASYDEALQCFQRSLEITPQQPAVLTAIGIVRARQGQADQAREAFHKALAIDPNYQPAKKQLSSLGGP
ncbi:MAG TPA: tetratricopeptide repeat protein [Blastocatellia bacterium]|nr:tetratricopeptide repeat protein [Blastocatellia bacterium]